MYNEIDKIAVEVWNKITNRKKTGFQEVTNEHEFYYLAGQTVYYLLSRDKRTLRRNQDISSFLNCKKSGDLKLEITKFYKIVSRSITLNNVRFNNAYNLILKFTDDSAPMASKENENFFMVGFLGENLMYRKIAKNNK
jgi:CRISPR-associated protein Csh1